MPSSVYFPEDREDLWMQAVAAEMNLSETGFLLERATATGSDGSHPKSKSISAAMPLWLRLMCFTTSIP